MDCMVYYEVYVQIVQPVLAESEKDAETRVVQSLEAGGHNFAVVGNTARAMMSRP